MVAWVKVTVREGRSEGETAFSSPQVVRVGFTMWLVIATV